MTPAQRSLFHSVVALSNADLQLGREYDVDCMEETMLYEKLTAVQSALLLPDTPKEFYCGAENILKRRRFWDKRSWPLNCRPDDLYEWYLFGGCNEYPSFMDALSSDELFTISYKEFEGYGLEGRGECECLSVFSAEMSPVIAESETFDLFFNQQDVPLAYDALVRWASGEGYCRWSLITIRSSAVYRFLKDRAKKTRIEERIAGALIKRLSPFGSFKGFASSCGFRDESKEYVLHFLCGYSDFIQQSFGLCDISPSFVFERALLRELLKKYLC